jgi:predicted DNA-binding ribbon-helix-helix protein
VSRGGHRPGAGRPRKFAEGAAVPRTIRLPEIVWVALQERADDEGVSLAQLVASLVRPA